MVTEVVDPGAWVLIATGICEKSWLLSLDLVQNLLKGVTRLDRARGKFKSETL